MSDFVRAATEQATEAIEIREWEAMLRHLQDSAPELPSWEELKEQIAHATARAPRSATTQNCMSRSFVDANVVILARGGDSPWRQPCAAILRASARSGRSCLASAEVLQDVIHHPLLRRGLQDRAIESVRWAMRSLSVEPLLAADVPAAAARAFDARLSSRDRIHAAAMQRLGLDTIISTDRGFDLVPGVRRLDPLAFGIWRAEVFGAG